MHDYESVYALDTHTEGEPTRVVADGCPDLGTGSLTDLRERFRDHHDEFRSAVVNEPRGSDVLVGALLVPAVDPSCAAGVIFFNNVGPLWMCGHGTIGVAVALAHLGRIGVGSHRLETPVGVVGFDYHGGNRVTIENVPSYRSRADVRVEVDGVGVVRGDVAWGGNWFFLCADHGEEIVVGNSDRLLRVSGAIRRALESAGITGDDGGVIDHIELVGPPGDPGNHARNFVLCPGAAYDRSPCGTGTSAKLACLAADGKLAPGEVWRQESVIGSVFEGTYRPDPDDERRVIPSITGSAYVTGENTLLLDPNDPFCHGIRR